MLQELEELKNVGLMMNRAKTKVMFNEDNYIEGKET